MNYRVAIIQDAEDDIFEIYRYIYQNESKSRADHVLNKLNDLCNSLGTMPHRGHIPPELDRINFNTYLEVHFKPYRIIYEIDGKKVFIHCVLDGRRDIQSLLERRLLRL